MWGYGSLLVRYGADTDIDEAVVCFAAPGVTIHGESGLGVATWRYATWPTEGTFAVGDTPSSFASMEVAEACREFPPDFHRWAERETAAHIERLRAFARRRRGASSVAEAADDLDTQLEEAFPGALRRYQEQCHQARLRHERTDGEFAPSGGDQVARKPGTTHTHTRDRIPCSTPADRVRLRALTREDFKRFALTAMVLGTAYAVYRALRTPVPPTEAVPANESALQPVFEPILMAYGYAHVAITALFLVWVYLYRNTAFEFVRNALLLACTMAAIPYLLFFNPGYSSDPSLHIPVAAIPTMPALHLAAALTVGISGALLARMRIVRALMLAFPLIVLALLYASQPRLLPQTIVLAVVAPALAWTVARVAAQSLSVLRRGIPPRTLALRARAADLLFDYRLRAAELRLSHRYR